MKHTLTLTAALMIGAVTAGAVTLTPEQALARFNAQDGQARMAARTSQHASELVLSHTTKTELGQPAAYIFSRPLTGGFVVLAADDVAVPVLGYSDSGTFNPDQMPEAMRWWLGEYSRQIEYARSLQLPPVTVNKTEVQRQPIEPMLTSRWDQIAPYFNSTPLSGTEHTYTGCVATSMAQVMNYWKHPLKGTGEISYNCESIGKRLTTNFGSTTFDWDNMLDSYLGDYTEEQAAAVATLMKACGYAVKMQYSTSASSAFALDIRQAMVKYFDYDASARYVIRSCYSAEEWDNMMYDNLLNVGPMPIGGSSMLGGGHSFVCDGYDGNGYYHFNWGWSGMSDGYFLFDALSPSMLGTGGGGGGGYNFSQDAVIGLRPATGTPAEEPLLQLYQAGNLTGTITGSTLRLQIDGVDGGSWINYTPQQLNVLVGAEIKAKDAEMEPIYLTSNHTWVTLKVGYAISPNDAEFAIDLSEANLPDGEYTLTVVTQIRQEKRQEWIAPVPFYPYSNSLDITKTGDTYSIKAHQIPSLRVVDGGVRSSVYYGGMYTVYVEVANDTDVELTGGFAPAFYRDGSIYFIGESKLVTLQPHTSTALEWTTEMIMLQQEWFPPSGNQNLLMTFFDEYTMAFYSNDLLVPVTMLPNAGTPSPSISNFNIPGATRSLERVNGKPYFTYTISNKLNIPVEFDVKLTSDVPFCYQMLACILSGTTIDDGAEILTYCGQPLIIESASATPTRFSTTLGLPDMEPETLYSLVPAYLYGSSFVPVGGQYLLRLASSDPSAIENVHTDAELSAPIYNLQGISVGADLDRLPGGIYIRDGRKVKK